MSEGTSGALPWRWLGRLDYRTGTAQQRAHRDRLLAGDEGAAGLLLLEHEPVITLGKSAGPRHLLATPETLVARGIELVHTDRGGDITYHGPGQLMVYPVIRLKFRLVEFLASIAGVLAQVAAEFAVPGAEWRCNPAGLWLGERKLAACGVHLRRSVCTHGFSFNVATPDEPWQLIVPCGLANTGVTSLAAERARQGLAAPFVAQVAERVGPPLARLLCEQHRRAPGN